ncbi:hypothetical protein HD553DRAFT_311146 [Filobasidium floriforme]|uniref:uncharacterized protein n=1 Tax=Filobasidium floriforme TaxID=5210 RepID=UPI001E8E8758|nr:uncharacterized protein HD553DRAFT_311146 [Filobasidium floriforme]KAH8085378.1 hypothetical protein HD553DRAFT_311146 [Filobasidium floriforme]
MMNTPGTPSSAATPRPSSGNEACVQCRRIKRKCHRLESQSTCVRCQERNLDCTYKQAQRGRKPGKSIVDSTSIRDRSVSPTRSRRNAQDRAESLGSQPRTMGPDEVLSHPSSTLNGRSSPSPLATHFSLSRITKQGVEPTMGADGQPAGSLATAFDDQHIDAVGFDPSIAVSGIFSDPLTKGLLVGFEVEALFAFYFDALNDMIALLDPALHSPTYCRNSSGILFTSILTVAAKVTRPDLYPRLLAMCEEMSVNCFRTGSRDIGYIQSVILLAFWRQAHDSTAWIMFGHAIRLGFAIGLHRFARRPLPSDELQARLILNRERTWLPCPSRSLAMQYQLPTTIPAESKYRARSWVEDHRQLMCPQDGFLATCLEVCQLFRLLADLPACQERPNQTDHLLQLINKEWLEWKSVWFTGNQLLTTDRALPTIQGDVYASTTVIPLRPRQKSLMRFCDHVVRFHITERHWVGQTKSAPGSSGTALALMDCFDAAIEVVLSFATDLSDHGILPYAQDMVWIASSSAAIWIKRAFSEIPQTERDRAIHTLQAAQTACVAVNRQPDDMPGFASRLMGRLLQDCRTELATTAIAPAELQPRRTSQGLSSGQGVVDARTANPSDYLFGVAPLDFADPFAFLDLSMGDDQELWHTLFPGNPS